MPVKDLSQFSGVCDQTMVGFVQRVNGGDGFSNLDIKCFYAVLNE
jgi:hypothetical protein